MRETAVNPDLNHLLPMLTAKFAKVYSIDYNGFNVPTLPKGQESRRAGHKSRVEGPQGQFSVPTLAKVPESNRRWRKTRVEKPQSQVRTARTCRADTRIIKQTVVTDI